MQDMAGDGRASSEERASLTPAVLCRARPAVGILRRFNDANIRLQAAARLSRAFFLGESHVRRAVSSRRSAASIAFALILCEISLSVPRSLNAGLEH